LAIKNSSTIALPQWYEVLESVGLKPRMMPRDVATRWNSTYDMLEFATEYRAALDTMTADHDMKLRQFELSKREWAMATELHEALQVRPSFLLSLQMNWPNSPSDFQARNPVFFMQYAQHQHCDSGHGPHRRIPSNRFPEP